MLIALTKPTTEKPIPAGIVYALTVAERINESMTKTLDVITDIIRNTKHPFRQVDDRPDKPQKHRYERRKIKEIIKAGDWIAENQT